MNVLSFVQSMDGCSYHRVHLPNHFVDANVRTVRSLTEEDLAWCDLLIYSRHTVLSVDFLDSLRKKHGFKIIVDTDDWWEVGPDHPKSEWFRLSNTSIQLRLHLMNADAVICTHERLAAEVRNLNKNVYVIPNMIPYGEFQYQLRTPEPADKFRILYASTIMNVANTEQIATVMHKLTDLPVEIVIAGYHESKLFDRLIGNLTANGKLQYRTIDMLPADQYMHAYEGDLLIVPSKNTKFNSMKSNLKILEAAVIGVPVLVPPYDPYIGMADYPTYYSGGNDFVNKIRMFVENPGYARHTGDRLRSYCLENYDMKRFNRTEVYEKIQRSNSNSR